MSPRDIRTLNFEEQNWAKLVEIQVKIGYVTCTEMLNVHKG